MSPTLYTARDNGKENNGERYNNDKQWNKVWRSLEYVSEFPLKWVNRAEMRKELD